MMKPLLALLLDFYSGSYSLLLETSGMFQNNFHYLEPSLENFDCNIVYPVADFCFVEFQMVFERDWSGCCKLGGVGRSHCSPYPKIHFEDVLLDSYQVESYLVACLVVE